MISAKIFNGASVDIYNRVSFPDIISDTVYNNANIKPDDPFYVCDLGDIVSKHKLWTQMLPRIQPFFAMKCNPDPVVVKLLASMDVGFDCASKGEISQAISLGVSPDNVIYANPCKQISHIKYAESNGVTMMTFDSAAELRKISKIHPDCRLLLRIFVGNSQARCALGLKFGANLADVHGLLCLAKELGLNVVGVSFHVGSGCFAAPAYTSAINHARYVFDIAHDLKINMSILDIGGGFPGNLNEFQNLVLFDDICSVINESIDIFFPPESGVKIIAEPGRFYVSSAFQLACTVTSIRESVKENPDGSLYDHYGYYLNDGVYGSFNCTIFDHYIGEYYILSGGGYGEDSEVTNVYESTFWGPTCDSMDKVLDSTRVRKLEVGERVIFKNMGAYTMAAASSFNGFCVPFIRWVSSQNDWADLYPLLEEKVVVSPEESVVYEVASDSRSDELSATLVDLCDTEIFCCQ